MIEINALTVVDVAQAKGASESAGIAGVILTVGGYKILRHCCFR